MTPTRPLPPLSADQRRWLRAVYERSSRGLHTDYRAIRAALYDRLPRDFTPWSIPRVYVYGDGLTPLGILAVEPDAPVFERLDRVAYAVRDLLLAEPDRREVTAAEVANRSGLDEREAGAHLLLLASLGPFARGGSRYADDRAAYLSIGVGDADTFDAYLAYEGAEPLLRALVERYWSDEERQAPTAQPAVSPQAAPNGAGDGLTVYPLFRSRVAQVNLHLCFVLMPFTETWSDRVWRHLIRPNVEALGLQCVRADNADGPIVIEDIWTLLNQAAFVVADVTGRNANVMYELGIAHTLGKPVVLVSQEVGRGPFDVQHLHQYAYEDNTDGFARFSERLPSIVRRIYADHYGGALPTPS